MNKALRTDLAVWAWLAPLLFAAAAYWPTLPSTVQGLDTGELTACAFGGHVAHPPGYPLYLALYGLTTHVVPWGTVFWRASVTTAGLAVATLGIVGAPALTAKSPWRTRALACAGIVVPLAMCPLFWAYAILPDVFMLHAFISALYVYLYLRPGESLTRVFGMSFTFGLGILNHHTIVFLLPLLVHALLQQRRWSMRLGCCAALFILFVGGYAALLLCHPDSIYSWGEVVDATSLRKHVLRAEYGLMRLSAHGKPVKEFPTLVLFAKQMLRSMPLAVGTAMTALFVDGKSCRRRMAVGGCLLLYVVVFFWLANETSPIIVERFLLLPMVLIALLAHEGSASWAPRMPRLILLAVTLLSVAFAVSSFGETKRQQSFSQRTVVEDYALNLLAMPPERDDAIVVVGSDTQSGALAYAQVVLGVEPKILVLNRGRLASTAYRSKVFRARRKLQDQRLRIDWAQCASATGTFSNLVRPAATQYPFYLTEPLTTSRLAVTVLGLGRSYRAGSGLTFDNASRQRLHCRSQPGPAGSRWVGEERALYAQYEHYRRKQVQLLAPSAAEANPIGQPRIE